MAIKELTTRIQLKYDSYENWTKTTVAGEGANLVLKAGEIGICHISAAQAEAAGLTTNESAVLFKVGDGVHTYSELEWCSGPATDVYNWAKTENKPTYSADEILNLSSYISNIAQDTIPPEVTSSIETHGMGWTSEEEVEGFDITWDGNTEGKQGIDIGSMEGSYYKVSDIPIPKKDVIGSFITIYSDGEEVTAEVVEQFIVDEGPAYMIGEMVVVVFDTTGMDAPFEVGTYFVCSEDSLYYIKRLHRESYKTENTHNINPKYLPNGGFGYIEEVPGFVLEWDGDAEGLAVLGEDYYCVDTLGINLETISMLTVSVMNTTSSSEEVYDAAILEEDGFIMIVPYPLGANEPFVVLRPMSDERYAVYLRKTRTAYVSKIVQEPDENGFIHQIDKKYIPSGSGGPEVENAIETGGMGWTTEQEVEGFDITWDGDTEGLENIRNVYFRVAIDVTEFSGVTSMNDFIGATVVLSEGGMPPYQITSFERFEDNIYIEPEQQIIVLTEDTEMGLKGVYFAGGEDNAYVARLYKEASTEEVVHQIDQKYIPSSPEVTNAIKTGGIGWTNEKVDFDISWEGDVRGLDETGEGFYKVSSTLEGITSKDDLVGATIVLTTGDQTFEEVLITDELLYTTDNIVYGCVLPQFGGIAAAIAFDDGDIEEADTYSQGIWFVNTGDIYVSRLYKDAVHKIDPKYLPEVIGDPGATFIPSVDSDGNLSWTNDKGLDNPETCNIKGPRGDVGLFVTDENLPTGNVGEDEPVDCGLSPSAFVPHNTPAQIGDYVIWLRNGGVYQITAISPSGATATVSRVSSLRGIAGKSAYEVALDQGFVGAEQQWLASLKGAMGVAGKDGADGTKWYVVGDPYVTTGQPGDLALCMAYSEPFVPYDILQWQNNMVGWQQVGNIKGTSGTDGHTPVKGTDYWTTADKQGIVNDVKNAIDLTSYETIADASRDYLPKIFGSLSVPTKSIEGSDYIAVAKAPDDSAEKVTLSALKQFINTGMQPGISIANPITSKCVIGASTSPHFSEETVETSLETLYSMVVEKGTYSKPSDGIPASDLASGVIPAVPTSISQLSDDSTHRVVTDAEKSAWNAKQDAISDITIIRSGAALGATALQEHQDISGKQDKSTLEADVAAKGFTKNTGTYSKPSGGIPKTDLASDVQASLGKAVSALQEHQSLAGYATETWVENKGYLTQHQSLAAYRTASAQDAIDNNKQDKLNFEGTYNASTNKVVTKSYVDDIVGDILNRLTNI